MNPRDLKIVFMGTPDFAATTLRTLVDGGFNVVGVVTVPDKPSGRGQQLAQSAVKNYTLSLLPSIDIALMQPEKLRSEEFLSQLSSLDADLFIVVAFRMLPEVVWSMPRLGTFNLHASLLPDYRGAAPINWAIINGEKKSGVTTFFLDDKIDCGAIIDRREVDVSATETAGSLHDKLMIVGAELVVSTIEKIDGGQVELKMQPATDNVKKAAPKIFKQDCYLNFSAIDSGDAPTAEQFYNKIRGLSPYPAAWCEIKDVASVDGGVKECVTAKIFESHYSTDNAEIPTGTWDTDHRTYLRVRVNGGWLYIDQLQPQSKKQMNIADFLRGWR